jgi:nicotinamidase-related amidase
MKAALILIECQNEFLAEDGKLYSMVHSSPVTQRLEWLN